MEYATGLHENRVKKMERSKRSTGQKNYVHARIQAEEAQENVLFSEISATINPDTDITKCVAAAVF